MIVSDLAELLLYPVADRGVPNSERVPILVREATDMGRYGLMIGFSGPNRFAMPFQDNLFWFGDGVVNAGDWILVFTGSGNPKIDDWTTPPGSKVYSVHWGRPNTMFANSQIVPILFRTDSAIVGQPQGDLPQLKIANT
ncbi:MAG: hypothetical protein PHP70_03820 [Gallionella sp.]|nr:hypothetical protein [Gallionella sp.]